MTRLIFAALLALVPLSLLFAGSIPDAHAVQESAPTGENSAAVLPLCTTCEGKGKLVLPCGFCAGDGKAPCSDCDKPDFGEAQARAMAILRMTDPDRAAKYDEGMAEIQQTMAELREVTGLVIGESTPGTLRCPAGCSRGVSYLNPGFPCKVCKQKGGLRCDSCKGKGESRCQMCQGKRKREQHCPECAGRRTSPDPLLRTESADACPWCNDRLVTDCIICDQEGRELQDCGVCATAGHIVCDKCSGTSDMGCNKCSGTGDLTSYHATKSSNSCDKCGADGKLDCTHCKKGRKECPLCAGKGRHLGACSLCVGFKMAPCDGCLAGSTRAWEVTADRLAVAKKYAEALAHLDVAVARCQRGVAAEVESFVGTAEERRALEKVLNKKVAQLKRRRIALKKKL